MSYAEAPVPGTVHLVDLEGTSRLRHGKSNRDIILIPQPSNDPNDPLNWSPRRRMTSTICQHIWTFFGAMIINGLTPAYILIGRDTGASIADLNLGNGLMYLAFGFSNLVVQPYALNYGRRPAACYSFLIVSCLVLWASYMQSAAEWYANRILIGFFFAGIECLPELMVCDTRFTHERGFHMGFYSWALFGGAYIGPIPAGFIADSLGWRWINRIYAIIGFGISVGLFLFCEETMFYRPHTVEEFRTDSGEESEAKTVEPVHDHDGNLKQHTTKNTATDSPAAEVGETYEVKGMVQRMKLWGLRDPRQPNTFFKFMLVPIALYRYPSIVFSGFLVGGVLAWYNVLLGTMTSVFSGAPYNFSANSIGLTYLACLIGTTIGSAVAGGLNDRLATFLARRNGGIKEPEARLWAAIIPMIVHPAGCVLYGVGASKQIHWAGVCVGIVLINIGILVGATLAFSYAVDSYKEVAGEAIVSVVLIRNLIGFAFAYAVAPMVDSLGLQGAFLLMGFLGMGFYTLCIAQIFIGKSFRRNSAVSYWKLVEKFGFTAH